MTACDTDELYDELEDPDRFGGCGVVQPHHPLLMAVVSNKKVDFNATLPHERKLLVGGIGAEQIDPTVWAMSNSNAYMWHLGKNEPVLYRYKWSQGAYKFDRIIKIEGGHDEISHFAPSLKTLRKGIAVSSLGGETSLWVMEGQYLMRYKLNEANAAFKLAHKDFRHSLPAFGTRGDMDNGGFTIIEDAKQSFGNGGREKVLLYTWADDDHYEISEYKLEPQENISYPIFVKNGNGALTFEGLSSAANRGAYGFSMSKLEGVDYISLFLRSREPEAIK